MADETVDTEKRKKERSPAYPSVPLEDAIAKAEIIWKNDKAAPASMGVIAQHLSSSPKSSGFLQLIATLKQFGLLEEIEGANPRQLKLSRRAVDIFMLEEKHPTRLEAIKAAAIAPKAHKDLWNDYPEGLASDGNVEHHLFTKRKFQIPAARELIRVFKKTMAYAGLNHSDNFGGANQVKPPEVNDLIQWTSRGVAQFTEPQRIDRVEPDGEWLFVEGSNTGIPVSEVTVIEAGGGKGVTVETTFNVAGDGNATPPPLKTPPVRAGTGNASGSGNAPAMVLDLPRGNRIEIRLRSKVTPEEFEKIKKIYELSALSFVDESGGGTTEVN